MVKMGILRVHFRHILTLIRDFALMGVNLRMADFLVELRLHRGIGKMFQLMGRQMNISSTG
jgi:hypothetical protein